MGSHLCILGNLRHRYHKLALSYRFLESVKAPTIKIEKKNWLVVFMFQVDLVSTFSEAIYRLIRMGHKSISVLTYGFNN